jgi:hypothetical protein
MEFHYKSSNGSLDLAEIRYGPGGMNLQLVSLFFL